MYLKLQRPRQEYLQKQPPQINNPVAQTNGVFICIFSSLFVKGQEKLDFTSLRVIATRRPFPL